MSPVVLGTRGSPLALWQARHVAARLKELHPGLEIEIRTIRTEGDRVTDRAFGDLPGRGFFVKEIEDALLARTVDLAVHSLKDMPTEQPGGLSLAAVLKRHDPRDAVLSIVKREFGALPQGEMVATGSPRRRAQLLHARPDLQMTLVRGNIDTRIRRLREGRFGAMVLALAGIERLGLSEVPASPIAIETCLPAVGQGAIAVEIREGDRGTRGLVEAIEDRETRTCVDAERAFLHRLGGGCLAPATAHARIEEGEIVVEAMVGDPDGRRLLREGARGIASRARALALDLAVRLLDLGAEGILRDARAGTGGGAVS